MRAQQAGPSALAARALACLDRHRLALAQVPLGARGTRPQARGPVVADADYEQGLDTVGSRRHPVANNTTVRGKRNNTASTDETDISDAFPRWELDALANGNRRELRRAERHQHIWHKIAPQTVALVQRARRHSS